MSAFDTHVIGSVPMEVKMNSFYMWFAPFFLFFIFSLGLFIWDGVKAKEAGRKRKTWIMVLAIISFGLMATVIILSVLLLLLTIAIVQNM